MRLSILVMTGLWLVSGLAAAQEVSFRNGVVVDIAPIQVAATATAQPAATQNRSGGAMGRALGRSLGRAVGRVTGDSEYAVATQDIAASAVQDFASAAPASDAGTVTAYIVVVRFDDGSESAIQTADATRLAPGGRVRVLGSGSAAQILPAG